MPNQYNNTLKATSAVAVGSIRNETRFNVSRCCTARLQFIKGNLPLVLGAATFNGSVSIFRLKLKSGYGLNDLTCLSYSKAAPGLIRSRRENGSSMLYDKSGKSLCKIRKYRGFSNRACGMARSCYSSGSEIGSVCVLHLSGRNYSSWLRKGCETNNRLKINMTNELRTIRDEDDQPGQVQTQITTTTTDTTTRVLNISTSRRFLLITLNHAERGNRSLVTTEDIITRLTARFTCRSIIICTEGHKNFGYHKHIGVWNETASKNTVQRVIREAFPEFEGRQCNVSTHKVWETICQYVLKEDKTPYVWGEESLEKVRERAGYEQRKNLHFTAPKSKTGEMRKIPEKRGKIRATNTEVLRRLSTKNTWGEVLEDEILGPRCVTNYQNMYRLFLDFKLFKLRKSLDLYLPTSISNLIFPFIRVFYVNQNMVPFYLIALISCFIPFLKCVDFCVPHILKGWDFLALFTAEFDFITFTWDCYSSEPERPDMGEHPSMASGIKPNWGLCGFLVVLISIVGYICLKND